MCSYFVLRNLFFRVQLRFLFFRVQLRFELQSVFLIEILTQLNPQVKKILLGVQRGRGGLDVPNDAIFECALGAFVSLAIAS